MFMRYLLAPLLYSLSMVSAAEQPSHPVTLTLAYEPDHNPPHALGSSTKINWEKPGITLELLKLVEERTGVTFQFKRLPWKRGLYLLKKNDIDGLFHGSYKIERSEVAAYPMKEGVVDSSRSIFNRSYALYKLKQSPVAYDGNAISGLKGAVGIINGYSIGGKLKKMGVTVVESNNQRENFRKLKSGEIAAYAMLENMADDYIKRNDYELFDVEKVEPALTDKPYYLMLSHQFVEQHPQLAERIWDTMRSLKTSAELRAIRERY